MGEQLKAVILTRVSTDEQVRSGTSLDFQYKRCVEKARSMGATVVRVYEEPGESGAGYRTRKNLQAALSDIEQGRADILISKSIDRLSRTRRHQSTIIHRIEQADGQVVFVDNDFEDTPGGKFARNVMGDYAEMEREVIRERSMNGKVERAEQGIQTQRGFQPLGYRIVTRQDVMEHKYTADELGRYIIIESEAKIVREIFNRYASGESSYQIVKWLNDSKVPTTRGGAVWHSKTIRVIIDNPTYKGTAPFRRYRIRYDEGRLDKGLQESYTVKNDPAKIIYIPCPQIVTEAVWNKCQEQMVHNRDNRKGNPEVTYLLSGMLKCSGCGMGMRGIRLRIHGKDLSKGLRPYYRCRQDKADLLREGHKCSARGFRADDIEAKVIREVIQFATFPERLETLFAIERAKKAKSFDEGQYREMVARVRELERQEHIIIEGQLKAIEMGVVTAVYDNKLREVSVERTGIQNELEAMKAIRDAVREEADDDRERVEFLVQTIHDIQNVLEDKSGIISTSDKRNALMMVINSIEADQTGKVNIRFKDFR